MLGRVTDWAPSGWLILSAQLAYYRDAFILKQLFLSLSFSLGTHSLNSTIIHSHIVFLLPFMSKDRLTVYDPAVGFHPTLESACIRVR